MLDMSTIAESLSRILSLVEKVHQAVKSSQPQPLTIDPNRVYDNNEIMILLNIKDKYIKKLRDNGYIAYSRHADKYWYRGTDVIDFLDRFHYPAFTPKVNLPKE